MRSLAAQTLPAKRFEVIVVNDRPPPRRLKAATEAACGPVDLTNLFVDRCGPSLARNAGISRARGDYVAFLDDDAEADTKWLDAIIEAFRRSPADVACVGGRVLPPEGYVRPRWLPPEAEIHLSLITSEQRAVGLRPKVLIASANLTCTREALAAVGGFRQLFGQKRGVLLKGEDNDLRRRLRDLGYHTCYDPSVVVYHEVPRSRLTKRWLWLRSYWQGISDRWRRDSRVGTSVLRVCGEAVSAAAAFLAWPSVLCGSRVETQVFARTRRLVYRIGRHAGRLLL